MNVVINDVLPPAVVPLEVLNDVINDVLPPAVVPLEVLK